MKDTKDFDKYAYFRSKAANYALCIKSRRTAIVDGEPVVKAEGLRVEFRNRMIRIEKDELGMIQIKALRDEILKEKDLIAIKKSLFEEKKADVMVSQTIVDSKDAEIAALKGELKENKKPTPPKEGKVVRINSGTATPQKDK